MGAWGQWEKVEWDGKGREGNREKNVELIKINNKRQSLIVKEISLLETRNPFTVVSEYFSIAQPQ